MKRMFLIAVVLLYALVANAQTIGAKLGTEVFLPSQYSNAVVSPEAGVYFDQPLIGRLGISLGAEYVYTKTQPELQGIGCCGLDPFCGTNYFNKTEIVRHGVQLPVSVTFDMLRNRNRSWFATLAYGVNPAGDLMNRYSRNTSIGYLTSENGALVDGHPRVRFPMHAGFEVRHVFPCNGSFAFGTLANWSTSALKLASDYPAQKLSFYVKTGFSLKKQR